MHIIPSTSPPFLSAHAGSLPCIAFGAVARASPLHPIVHDVGTRPQRHSRLHAARSTLVALAGARQPTYVLAACRRTKRTLAAP
ncbi:hypothetical protein MSAN_01223900 [Mycena sanguinolenta]|uniref:Uncharacterized protein n=1 Tax=Mycena sanguinolenta TaxID=230812 RepID=A0A8H7D4P9_9AGAR|nr:hypothetical protein MSAN_01223900 [Mycena sanguinolenta]